MNIRRVIEIRYAQIRSIDLSNGEGVGVALFVQGCHFHCENCFNPETWDFSGGKEWTQEIRDKFLELVDRPYIKRVSILGGEPLAEENLDGVLDLVTEVNKRYNTTRYIDGNMQENHKMLNENANEFRLSCPQKFIWIYSGYTWEECQPFTEGGLLEPAKFAPNLQILLKKRNNIISNCDVLVDGRYIDSQRDITLPYRGSTNQRLVDIQQSLQKGEIILWQT